jgi:hypothetical protein
MRDLPKSVNRLLPAATRPSRPEAADAMLQKLECMVLAGVPGLFLLVRSYAMPRP